MQSQDEGRLQKSEKYLQKVERLKFLSHYAVPQSQALSRFRQTVKGIGSKTLAAKLKDLQKKWHRDELITRFRPK